MRRREGERRNETREYSRMANARVRSHRPASVAAPTRLSPLRRCSLCLLRCRLLLLHPLRVFACPLHPPYLVSTRPLRPQSLPRPPSERVNVSTRTLSTLTRLRPPSLPPQLVSACPLLLQSLPRPPFPPSPCQRQRVPSQCVNARPLREYAYSRIRAPSPRAPSPASIPSAPAISTPNASPRSFSALLLCTSALSAPGVPVALIIMSHGTTVKSHYNE